MLKLMHFIVILYELIIALWLKLILVLEMCIHDKFYCTSLSSYFQLFALKIFIAAMNCVKTVS